MHDRSSIIINLVVWYGRVAFHFVYWTERRIVTTQSAGINGKYANVVCVLVN